MIFLNIYSSIYYIQRKAKLELCTTIFFNFRVSLIRIFTEAFFRLVNCVWFVLKFNASCQNKSLHSFTLLCFNFSGQALEARSWRWIQQFVINLRRFFCFMRFANLKRELNISGAPFVKNFPTSCYVSHNS